MENTSKRVFVEGYGCSANMAETEQIKGYLKSQNCVLAHTQATADIIVVNSCGVKKMTEFKMKRRVEKLKQLNPKATIVVSGCLPKINPSLLANQERVVQTGPNLHQIAQIAGLKQETFSPTLEHERFNEFVSIIPISNGCLSNCSFCGTKKARGNLKSNSIEIISQRLARDLQNNTKEFWLVSQDNGCYGIDLGTNLAKLLKTLLSNKGDFRIRIGMMSPQYLNVYYDEFVKLFEDERLYKFVHIPVQSGNNRILKLMRRQYTVEKFEELVKNLRKDIPGLSVSTDIIAGFPTETKQEFSDTLKLVERLRFDTVNISKYAQRPNTIAEKLPQVPDSEKNVRSHLLTRVCKNIFLEKHKEMVGRTEKILVTGKAKINGFEGRTNSYKHVFVPHAQLNEFAQVKIEEAFVNFVKGKPEQTTPIAMQEQLLQIRQK